MICARTKIFTSNRSQAVRLPKAVAFSDSIKEVEIIAPSGCSRCSSDFMEQREQPEDQEREML